MIVKELIKELKSYPEYFRVRVYSGKGYWTEVKGTEDLPDDYLVLIKD